MPTKEREVVNAKEVREVAKKVTRTGKVETGVEKALEQGLVKPTAVTGKGKGLVFMGGGRSPLDDRKAEGGK